MRDPFFNVPDGTATKEIRQFLVEFMYAPLRVLFGEAGWKAAHTTSAA